ncbi:MAG: DNA-processing protein DprA [Hyphomonadaceae bacterium]
MKRRQLTDAERADWLRLIRTPNVGPITFHQLLSRYETAGAALDALPALMTAKGVRRNLSAPSRSDIARELDRIDRVGARMVATCETDYPALLAAIDAPPPLVFTRGDITLTRPPGVALVGARNASAAGRRMARDLAHDLGEAGYVVISGLARGVDGEAHAAGLETGTIAVVAGGVDQIYPPEHNRLYERIVEQGLVIAEAPIGYTAVAKDFPRRNRIISGLSLAVIVVEAAERSGSLITARMALEQGREVMAVPGSPLDPRCKGANRLIKQGAVLVETADDIVRALETIAQPALFEPGEDYLHDPPDDVPPALVETVRTALSPTPMPVSEIVRAVDAPHRMVLAVLAELELAGEATTHAGGLASRAL